MYKNVHVHVSQKYCELHIAIELLVKNHVSDRMSSPCERPLVIVLGHSRQTMKRSDSDNNLKNGPYVWQLHLAFEILKSLSNKSGPHVLH